MIYPKDYVVYQALVVNRVSGTSLDAVFRVRRFYKRWLGVRAVGAHHHPISFGSLSLLPSLAVLPASHPSSIIFRSKCMFIRQSQILKCGGVRLLVCSSVL